MRTLFLPVLISLICISSSLAQNYCIPVVDMNHGECRITNVKFAVNGINRSSGANEKYVMTSATTSVARGTSVPIAVSGDVGYYCSAQNMAVYIDFNRNFVFEVPDEQVFEQSNVGTGEYSGTVSIPANAVLGTTRMRVMNKMVESCGHSAIEPCGSDPYVYHGEVEDYDITITATSDINVDLVDNPNLHVYLNDQDIVIEYELNTSSEVTLNIFNTLGQKIFALPAVNENAGKFSLKVNPGEIESARTVYIVQLIVGNKVYNNKFIY